MLTRARKAPSDEDGFIIIEVLVSAVILAIVAGAVLTLIASTTHSAAAARNHSTAYGLAQEDQARMRTLPISTLKTLKKVVKEPTINGTQFKVESKAFFVNNLSGTASCTEQNASTDYVEITSTVSSTTMPNPVSLQSIISPSSGSIDSTHGSLVFQANNARGEGVSKVSITASGPATISGETESTGCATFADIPSGNYKVTATAGGLITPEGSTTFVNEQVGAPNGSTQQVPIYFDTAGSVIAKFVYKEPTISTEYKAAPVDSMELFNSENGNKAVAFPTTRLATRAAELKDTSVYPFKTKYKVYAGSCTSNDPDPKGEGLNAEGLASVAVTAGGTAAATIRVPALNLTVTNSSGTAIEGATVIITDANCTSAKREFTTNKIGHIVNAKGELKSETFAVGLPFGTYNICASATISGQTRRTEATGTNAVAVSNLTTAATKTLALPSSGSSSACS
jgi:Tfp pilus assembly protein PilV